MKKKILVACLCVALAVLTVAGTTLAYLTSRDEVKNTFTVGKVKMELWETKDGAHDADKIKTETGYVVKERNDISIVPGVDIDKDPTVTIKGGSENSWVFIKVTEANWPAFTEEITDGETTSTVRKVNYVIDSTVWTQLTDANDEPVDGVYYREYNSNTADVDYNVLASRTVTVSGNLTMDDVEKINNAPTLTFTGYAIQKEGFTTAAAAWAEASK